MSVVTTASSPKLGKVLLRPQSGTLLDVRGRMTERRLALAMALLVAAAVVVPFLLLSSVARVSGAFLFWIVFALLVIALIVWATAPWKAQR